MKNKYITFFIIVAVLIFIVWFAFDSMGNLDDIKDDNTTNVEQNDDQVDDINDEQQEKELDIKTDSGRFSGQIDSNFVEVKISGVPDDIDPKVFMLSNEVKDTFDNLNLSEGDTIKFNYYINDNDQKVLVKIERI